MRCLRQQLVAAQDATAAAGSVPTARWLLQLVDLCLPPCLVDGVGALRDSWPLLTAGVGSTGNGMEWDATAAATRASALRNLLALASPPSTNP